MLWELSGSREFVFFVFFVVGSINLFIGECCGRRRRRSRRRRRRRGRGGRRREERVFETDDDTSSKCGWGVVAEGAVGESGDRIVFLFCVFTRKTISKSKISSWKTISNCRRRGRGRGNRRGRRRNRRRRSSFFNQCSSSSSLSSSSYSIFIGYLTSFFLLGSSFFSKKPKKREKGRIRNSRRVSKRRGRRK